MSETFWATVLGAFLSAGTGALLFFIQRCVQKRDEDQNLLFNIYQKLKRPIGPHDGGAEGLLREMRRRWAEVEGLTLLLRDKKLRKKIYLFVSEEPPHMIVGEFILLDIRRKLNKELYEEIRKEEEAAAKQSTPNSK